MSLAQLAIGGLSDVSLVAPAGRVICLSGASGSGKSRLLRAVADLEPHLGQVTLNGIDQQAMRAHQWRRRVTLVPADSQWWFDDVGAHFPDGEREPVPDALGFPRDVMSWSVSRLSSGERQRLALWRALSMQPKALLLDEPTANLDEAMTDAVENWLLEEVLRRDLAVLWVAHDPGQIRRVAWEHYRIDGALVERESVNGSD